MSSLVNNLNNSLDKALARKRLGIARIVLKMQEEYLPSEFAEQLFLYADRYEGIADLLRLWLNESDQREKDEIVADLQDEIEELINSEILKPKYIQFDNLDKIAEDVMEFKKSLRIEIDRWGGITKLSKATGIPVPSLSRFLKTPPLPRRITLEKIARAMSLKESDLLAKWAA